MKVSTNSIFKHVLCCAALCFEASSAALGPVHLRNHYRHCDRPVVRRGSRGEGRSYQSADAGHAHSGYRNRWALPLREPRSWPLHVAAIAPGFSRTEQKEVNLQAREEIPINLQLAIASAAATTVEVIGTPVIAEQLDADRFEVGSVINDLALNFRATASPSPIVVATLAPGVESDSGGNITICGPVAHGDIVLSRRHIHAASALRRPYARPFSRRSRASPSFASTPPPTVRNSPSRLTSRSSAEGGYQRFSWRRLLVFPAGGLEFGGPDQRHHSDRRCQYFRHVDRRSGSAASCLQRQEQDVLLLRLRRCAPQLQHADFDQYPALGVANGRLQRRGRQYQRLEWPAPAGNIWFPLRRLTRFPPSSFRPCFPTPTNGETALTSPNLVTSFPGTYTNDGFDGRMDHNFGPNHHVWGRVTQKTIGVDRDRCRARRRWSGRYDL